MSDDIEETFFNEESIKTFFLYFCHSNSESVDPITDAMSFMLNNTLQFIISRRGVYLFKDLGPVPFSIMSDSQRQLIYHISSSFRAQTHTYSGFNRTIEPLTYSIENECIVLHINKKKLDSKLLLTILLELIAESKQPSILLFNVLIQRLMSKIQMDKELLLYANEKSKIMFTSTTKHVPLPTLK
jgi:hypothetical protein